MRAATRTAGTVALLAALATGCAQVRDALPGETGPAAVTVHVTGADGSSIEHAVVELVCLPDPTVVSFEALLPDGETWTDADGMATAVSERSGQACQVRVRPTAGDWRPSILRVAALPSGRSRVDVVLEGR